MIVLVDLPPTNHYIGFNIKKGLVHTALFCAKNYFEIGGIKNITTPIIPLSRCKQRGG